ncbi:hypothetical protein T492DRAFT_931957, partial [Pavlovales sp. CCMP2436]
MMLQQQCTTYKCQKPATRALERAGPVRCPAWEHDKQQPADHLPKRPCPGTLPEIHRHAR